MRAFEPQVWGEHLTATERMMVDEMITHLRKPNEQSVAVEVRRMRDGSLQVFAVKRQALGHILRQ